LKAPRSCKSSRLDKDKSSSKRRMPSQLIPSKRRSCR
jgi:hypothetical protein